MRCDASDDCVGSTESDCNTAPLGDTSAVDAPTPPTSAIAAIAAIAHALTQRSTRSFVKEVQVLRIDCDLHAVAELQLDVWRERRKEGRPRADDACCVLVLELFLRRARLRLYLPRVDLEV